MYGAILGDMIGAPYEFDRGAKTKDFEMFNSDVRFTDDTVMTVAVADALLGLPQDADDEAVKEAVVESMREWGSRYPRAGYGARFFGWLRQEDPKPYGSWGNGSAMRVSSVGWLYDTLEETRHKARLTAEVTHNHPEGIKGAEAAASAIFMARTCASKEEIREYIVREFGYDLSRTCDEIRPNYHHAASCQETVPEAITAFLEGNDFEDVIRTAVSLGGDCDTLTCIAGSMAEAFYGLSTDYTMECRLRLPADMLDVLNRFEDSPAVIRAGERMRLRWVVEDLLYTLRECEDGSCFTTQQLLAEAGYSKDKYDDGELMEIHAALLKTAGANGITLDLSAHDHCLEGLPYNLDYIIRNEKARFRCPYCGSRNTARLIYGLPAFNPKMQKMLDEGKWALGGCLIGPGMPERKCNECGKEF